MDDPDVIVAIDGNPRDLPKDPIAWQWLWPVRLGLKFRDPRRIGGLSDGRGQLLGKSGTGKTCEDGSHPQHSECPNHDNFSPAADQNYFLLRILRRKSLCFLVRSASAEG
jgi:hypothetical protein